MRKYPKYKQSGVEWLGVVPVGWEVRRTRFMVELNPSKTELSNRSADSEVSFLPMEAVGVDGVLDLGITRPISEVSSGYTFFSDGDVTFAKITPCFENGKGAIMKALVLGCGFGTTELTVIRPGRYVDNKFLYYLTKSTEFRRNGEAWMYGAGGQKRVPDEFVREFRFCWPPLPEQQAIASYLDRETGRIDALIDKKQRIVELLKEKRMAMISRAVTKGLDPNVKMKTSGVEWLGVVPEHWEVKALRRVAAGGLCNGIFKKSDMYGDGTLLVNVSDAFVDDCRVHIGGLERVQTDEVERTRYAAAAGDIFFVRSSLKKEGIAKAVCMPPSDEAVVFECHLIRAKPRQSIANSDFLIHYLNSTQIKERLVSLSETTTMTTISQEKLASLELCLPPLPEQQAISTHLDRETAKLDALISKVNTAIDTLKEYRTALIAAAVTGKICVTDGLGRMKDEHK